jgi:nicotinamidase-related amidase
MFRSWIMALLALAALTSPVLLAVAPDAAAQAPPTISAPTPVTLDPATTAFLVLDLTTAGCAPRPGCLATIPAVAAFLDRARQTNVFVVYSSTAGATTLPEVAPRPDDPTVVSRADKFFNTQLDDLLRNRGIRTAVIVGTAANGAVLYTSFGANLRGYTVVVAEDGISALDDFAVLLTRYQLLNQPGFSNTENEPLREGAVTLSRTDLISFQ